MQHMLVIGAHPDDESFMAGGTIAKYVKSGWEVDIACATSGELGAHGPFTNVDGAKLGEIRRKELEKAGIVLGAHSIALFGYDDGSLKGKTPGDIEDKVFKLLLDIVPDVVITYEPGGITNHPDHIALSYAVTFAFQKYAKWVEGKEVDAGLLPKLYYACIPQSVVSYLLKKKGLPVLSHEKPTRGVPDKSVTTVINIAKSQDDKKRALRAHVSQTRDVDIFLHIPGQPLLQHEYFIYRMHGTTEVFMGKKDHVANRL